MTDDTDDEVLGRLVAEYSEEINQLRKALLWFAEHRDPRVAQRALRELKRQAR